MSCCFLVVVQVMERQLTDEKSSFWGDNFPGMVRERQAGVFSHVLSVIFVRGAYLYGLAEAATHGRSIIENNNEVKKSGESSAVQYRLGCTRGIVYQSRRSTFGLCVRIERDIRLLVAKALFS